MRYLIIHVYHEILLLGHVVVALVENMCDPIGEGLADDSGEEIDQPLAGEAVPVLLVGQVLKHLRVVLGASEDVLD